MAWELMDTNRNWRRLAAAILVRAALDAQGDDPALAAPARRWLSGEGAAWAGELDLDPQRVAGWVSNLPALAWEQLAFPL
jgi:hypothetical protein